MPYFYFYSSREGRTELISIANRESRWIHLRDLEGILITKNQIPYSEQEFLDSKKPKIEKQYKGKFQPFSDYN